MLDTAVSVGKATVRRARRQARVLDDALYALTYGRQLGALKELHAGKRCFIIGNGPSLKMHDLTKLAGEQKFATNMFLLHPDLGAMHLDFFCASDQIHWQVNGGFPEVWKAAFRRLPYCRFFFEKACTPIFRRTPELQDREVYFLNLDERRRVFAGEFSTDVTRRTAWGATVVVDFCLPLAYYMGFREVFLLGCDCDYQRDRSASFEQAFFYDRSLDPRRIPEWTGTPAHVQTMFDAYRVVKRVFEADGRKIYNAGHGGKLEVFERVRYDDLF